MTIRIGTIGTGSIVKTILETIEKIDGIACEAVCSRGESTARTLAGQFHIAKTYTVLEDMLQDEDIDLIYAASPNSLHYEQTKRALLHGKNVICEKPFVPTLKEAMELVSLAKEKGLFLFEGITTLHQPGYQAVRNYLPLIGNLKMALATFCQYSSRYDALMAGQMPNVFNPAFAGGALMDINLYNIYFLAGLFGKPERLHYFAGLHENGVDTHGILIMRYPGLLCQCTASKDSWCENGVQLLGDKGYIHVTPGSSNCQTVRVVRKDMDDVCVTQPQQPWYYEIQGLVKLISENDYDACYSLLDKTLEVVEILEAARKDAGLNF